MDRFRPQSQAVSGQVTQEDLPRNLVPAQTNNTLWCPPEQFDASSFDETPFEASDSLPLTMPLIAPHTTGSTSDLSLAKRRGRRRIQPSDEQSVLGAQVDRPASQEQSFGWEVVGPPSFGGQEDNSNGSTMSSSQLDPSGANVDRRTCFVCLKRFSDAFSVRMHIRVHTNEKPFACPHCPHRTAQKGNLKSHIRRHHGELANRLT
ncbi:zinc finger protein-like [Tropilaelaps mercedesae]|uniref:Zinc finger protein-like n=1 Tax=Tropilaelaps mercedesae TaxID=418985 RepID=A0A1V9XR80_9ACAR|nr:zinc finger protein-like [Tropilaelaps mercedesae]